MGRLTLFERIRIIKLKNDKADQIRHNRAKLLIANAGMLAINKSLLGNPGLTLNKLKTNLKSVVLLYCGVFDQLISGFASNYLRCSSRLY